MVKCADIPVLLNNSPETLPSIVSRPARFDFANHPLVMIPAPPLIAADPAPLSNDFLPGPGGRRCAVLYAGSAPQPRELIDLAEFHLHCATDHATALDALHATPINVIVCDLRHPEFDGIALLESVRRDWPGIARLALGPACAAALAIAALNRGGISQYVSDTGQCGDLRDSLRQALRIASGRDLSISVHGQLRTLGTLRESAKLLDDIVDNLPTAVQLKSVQDDFRLVLWNKAAEALYGAPRSAAIGRTVHELWPKELADRMHASDCELIAHGGIVDFPDRPAHNPVRGTIRTHTRKVPLYDNAGNPAHILVIADDISERLQAEQALRDAQARYQRALDAAQDGIWEYDLRTGAVFMSEKLQSMLHCSPDDLPAQHDATSHLVHPDDLESYRQTYAGLLKRGEILRWEGRFRQPDGSYRWHRVRGIATHGKDGRAILVSGTTSDIDETKRAQDELRQHRDNLAGLVEERTASLLEAKRAAECANMAKTEFLSNMSHELRTPMHAIMSFANFGVEKFEKVDPARLKGYFVHIQKSAGRLLKLLNDLLDLSKLEAGKMSMAPSPVDVHELMHDAALEVDALAEQRQILVRLDACVPASAAALATAGPASAPAGTDLAAVWDGPRILQVLRNLLSNAVKFSPAGSTIELFARTIMLPNPAAGVDSCPGIEVCVRDQGVGIPPGELDLIFDKFVQSSKTRTGAGGTGLGLAICREIVVAHGGTIYAESNAPPNPGTSFIVRLPQQCGRLLREQPGNGPIQT